MQPFFDVCHGVPRYEIAGTGPNLEKTLPSSK
jgi:hypothetical protein